MDRFSSLQEAQGLDLVVVVGLGVTLGLVALWLLYRVVRQRGTGTSQPADTSAAESDQLAAPGAIPAAAAESAKPSVLERMAEGLAGTRERMVFRMDELFRGRREIDDSLWRQLEELLVTSDVGIGTATRLLETLRVEAEREDLQDLGALRALLQKQVGALLASCAGSIKVDSEEGPVVIVVIGVNGAGKTTTIGKLAARNVRDGRKVVIGAGDTFRAAAVEQLMVWAERAGAELVKNDEGTDPAAVAHDAISTGVDCGAQLVICDTAGRLHTKGDLMDELQKIHRVAGKAHPGAPHEVLLVLDATTGQNAVMQAREFSAAVGVTGIVLTKLDGTARGGVILSIADEFDIPVKLIGIGEGVDDLRDFDPTLFVEALFGEQLSGLGRGENSADAAASQAGLVAPSTLA